MEEDKKGIEQEEGYEDYVKRQKMLEDTVMKHVKLKQNIGLNQDVIRGLMINSLMMALDDDQFEVFVANMDYGLENVKLKTVISEGIKFVP